MSMPNKELVVLDIAGSRAQIWSDDLARESALLALGFTREGEQLVRPIKDDADRQFLVRELIGMDALFSAGRDWSPAELVDFYREKGFITQSYRMISWKSPQQYLIVDR